MGRWDALRAKSKGEIGTLPHCSKCGTTSVLDPCRDCATPAQLAAYPEAPSDPTEKEPA